MMKDDRKSLIKRYEDMMYKYGEYDVWDDDIEPFLDNMSTKEIKKNYESDKKYYRDRELASGYW